MPKLPWVKWFPSDWMSDQQLRRCSAATRGVWADTLNAMMLDNLPHIEGTIDDLVTLTRCSRLDLLEAIREFEAFNVCEVVKQNGSIRIESRRRKKDADLSEKRADAGRKGGLNLPDKEAKDKQTPKQNTKQNVISSSNSSSGYSSSFESAWKAYGRQGSKKKAYSYWKQIPEGDHESIMHAIPLYLKCVEAGRLKSDFEGWVNPKNEKWANDWEQVLEGLMKKAAPSKSTLVSTHHAAVRDQTMHKDF